MVTDNRGNSTVRKHIERPGHYSLLVISPLFPAHHLRRPEHYSLLVISPFCEGVKAEGKRGRGGGLYFVRERYSSIEILPGPSSSSPVPRCRDAGASCKPLDRESRCTSRCAKRACALFKLPKSGFTPPASAWGCSASCEGGGCEGDGQPPKSCTSLFNSLCGWLHQFRRPEKILDLRRGRVRAPGSWAGSSGLARERSQLATGATPETEPRMTGGKTLKGDAGWMQRQRPRWPLSLLGTEGSPRWRRWSG